MLAQCDAEKERGCTNRRSPTCSLRSSPSISQKFVFQVAVADHHHHIIDRRRLSRDKFAQFLAQYEPATVLFESCGTAHYWARQAIEAGHDPKIIPA